MFNFGKNWQAFSSKILDERSVVMAEKSLKELLSLEDLTGYSFIDIGCGSGLFSIAAARLGAQVTAADVNPLCIKVTQQNAKRFLANGDINIRTLSALDKVALNSCGNFDIVYSWGVLHHTGAMWEAIENVSKLTKPGGLFVLSIYNKHFTSPVWKGIKWLYVHMPSIFQQVFVLTFGIVIFIAKFLVTWKNPLQKERGMNFWYDVIDWVGGYPYEYASVEEITQFMKAHGFKVQRVVPAQVPTGCNEFVFVCGEK